MPIRINLKEIFPSDSQDITVDKLNFNFNKLLELGVGDQGDQGVTGPQGAAGPIGLSGIQGLRGSTWFVDAGDPNTLTFVDLLDQDLYLDTITFSVWQYDELTTTWTQVLNFSSIVNYYISLSPSPFNRGFGIGSPQDDRFITFNRRGNDYVDSQTDVTRGSFNSADSDVLLLTNFNENTISNAIGFPNFPASPGEMFDALLKVYVNHSEAVSEVTGRYHLELGSLYLDQSSPAEPILSSLEHNLKVKFKKNDVSLTTAIPSTNTWVNIAQFSMSVPEPEPVLGIDQNGIFEFVIPKFNNEGLSIIRNEIKIRLGSAEGLTEYVSLDPEMVGDGIAISDSTGTFSAGIMRDLSNNITVPYSDDDFFFLNTYGLDGIFINHKTVQTNGTFDLIHTAGARFLYKTLLGSTNDANSNQDLSSIFSNGNILISSWAGGTTVTSSTATAEKGGILRINQVDSALTLIESTTADSVYPTTGGVTYDNHGHQSSQKYASFPTTHLTYVDFVGKYLYATRVRPQNYVGPVGFNESYDTLIVAELDSNGNALRPLGFWGDTGSSDEYYAKKVQVIGSTAFVLTKKQATTDWTSTDSYLHSIDVTDPTSLVSLDKVTTSSDDNYLDFTILNERAFISAYDDSANSIKIIKVDLHSPSSLTTGGALTTVVASGATEKPTPIKADGTRVYLGYGTKIYAYSTDNANSAVLTSLIVGGFEVDSNLRISDIIVNGNYMYVLGENSSNSYGELYTLDISTIATPVLVGVDSRSTLTAPGKMTLVGNKIYVTSSQGTGGLSTTDGGISIFELEGLVSPTADISAIKSNELKVSNKAYIGETLDVGSAINVGSGGVYVDGPFHVDGDVNFSQFSRVRVTSSTSQTITSNLLTYTTTDFNTTAYDSLGEFDLTSNRFTATYGGYYCFEFRARMFNTLTSHTIAIMASQLRDSNSNQYTIRSAYQAAVVDGLADEFIKQGNQYDIGGSRTIYLNSGDWVDVRISSYAQDFSAAVIDLDAGNSELIINRIG